MYIHKQRTQGLGRGRSSLQSIYVCLYYNQPTNCLIPIQIDSTTPRTLEEQLNDKGTIDLINAIYICYYWWSLVTKKKQKESFLTQKSQSCFLNEINCLLLLHGAPVLVQRKYM